MPDINLFIVVVVLVITIILTLMLRYLRARYIHNQQAKGYLWLKSMAELLTYIQQHRGLSNGYIQGSRELISDITPLQSRIRRRVTDIEAVGEWVRESERWHSIVDHWQRLSANYEKKESNINLKEHNALIQNLLFLIDDMAQSHQLLLMGRLQLLWRELLTTTEYIGQARAIGTGLSASGSCDSVSRIRLNYLCQKIVSQSELVWKDLELDSSKRQAVNKLVSCIQNNIIQDHVTIGPKEYFDIASQAINHLYEQYSHKVDQYFGRLSV